MRLVGLLVLVVIVVMVAGCGADDDAHVEGPKQVVDERLTQDEVAAFFREVAEVWADAVDLFGLDPDGGLDQVERLFEESLQEGGEHGVARAGALAMVARTVCEARALQRRLEEAVRRGTDKAISVAWRRRWALGNLRSARAYLRAARMGPTEK